MLHNNNNFPCLNPQNIRHPSTHSKHTCPLRLRLRQDRDRCPGLCRKYLPLLQTARWSGAVAPGQGAWSQARTPEGVSVMTSVMFCSGSGSVKC